jgi:hypothetical protein
MPVKLSKSGKSVVNADTGKTEKKFASKAKAKAYLTARNLAHARSRGYKVPRARKR